MTNDVATADPETQLKDTIARIGRHQAAGRHDAALDLIEATQAQYPDLAPLLHLKGMSVFALGDRESGLALIRDASEREPENAAYVADLGALLAQQGKINQALPYFEQATELAPKYAGAWTNLGAAHFMKEDYAAAIPHLRKAVALEPSLLDAQRNLGIALLRVQRFDAAVNVFYRALAIDPNDVSSHVHLSAALYRQERHDTAIYHAQKALDLAPEALEPHLHLGNAKASLGLMDEAEAHLLKAASLMPAGIGALSRLIHLRKTKPDSAEFKALKLLEDRIDKFGPRRRSTLHMAAGKAYLDIGDAQASFDHLAAGNALTAQEHPFDLENHIGQVDRMMAVASEEAIARLGGASGLDLAPIFVCGMPRSGTTLMELMLSRHTAVQAGGEMNASRVAIGQVRRVVDILEERLEGTLQADDVALIAEAYEAAVRATGISSKVLTDKLPINYMYVGLLALALPKARFVIMRRHPMDCCLSNWTQDFGRNQPFSTDFKSLGQVYLQYQRITDHWARVLPDRVRIVPYEDVVNAPEETMRAVVAFCGLDWEENVLDHATSTRPVNTASISQVRQPLYKTSVAKWHVYGPLLRPLAEELAPLLTAEDLDAAGITRN